MDTSPPYFVRTAGPADWPAVEAVLEIPGDPRKCWCQYFLLRGKAWSEASPVDHRSALREQVSDGQTPGLVAYDGEVPVGWVQVGPRTAYPRLLASRITAPPPEEADDDTWSVTCFVVPRPHRRRGVARGLLDAAVRHAREQGAPALEGYPVDTAVAEASVAELYHGSLEMFLDAGFEEVRRPTERRAVVRREL